MKNTNGNNYRKRYRRYTYAKGVECIRDIHGLRQCNTYFSQFNRDFNAARNILRIATCIIYDMPRPSYLNKTSDKSKIIKPKARIATKAINENQKKIRKLK